MASVREETARALSKKLGITIPVGKDAYDMVIYAIVEGAKGGKNVPLGDAGTLKVVKVDERTFRNPKTGAPIVKAAHRKFKLNGKEL